MKGIIGLVLIIIGLGLMIWSCNKDNDLFYYNRPYTLIKKHQSEHLYKGKYKPDYYFTVSYDDKEYNWTKSVQGTVYFSRYENGRYFERDIKPHSYIICVFWLVGIFCLVGIVLISSALTDDMF